jgi:predicted metal-binding membrane protein
VRALQPNAFGESAGRFTGNLRGIGRRPTFWVELGVGLAWVALAVASGEILAAGGSPGGPSWSSGSIWFCDLSGAGMAPGAGGHAIAGSAPKVASLAASLPMWALMAVAMMLPTAMPAVRHVAVNSLYWRRRRAVLEFIAVYLGTWAAFSALVLGVAVSRAPSGSAFVLPLVLAVAALWQLTPLKRRALRACHRPRPLPPYGWRATAGVARFGLGNGGACLASCWAMMLTMAVVGSARLAWMAALTALIAIEKLNLKPGRTARRIGLLLGTAAIAVAAIAVLGQPPQS